MKNPMKIFAITTMVLVIVVVVFVVFVPQKITLTGNGEGSVRYFGGGSSTETREVEPEILEA